MPGRRREDQGKEKWSWKTQKRIMAAQSWKSWIGVCHEDKWEENTRQIGQEIHRQEAVLQYGVLWGNDRGQAEEVSRTKSRTIFYGVQGVWTVSFPKLGTMKWLWAIKFLFQRHHSAINCKFNWRGIGMDVETNQEAVHGQTKKREGGGWWKAVEAELEKIRFKRQLTSWVLEVRTKRKAGKFQVYSLENWLEVL